MSGNPSTSMRRSRQLLVHQDVFDWLGECSNEGQKRRFQASLRQLLALGRTTNTKCVKGAAAGWWRTPLGGNNGSHYYLWWASAGTPPVRHLELQPGEIVIRRVRHHDETEEPLQAGLAEDCIVQTAEDLLGGDLKGDPLTPVQRSVLNGESRVRTLRGTPGTGKTYTLYEAARTLPGTHGLHLTWSRHLATSAKAWYEALAPEGKHIEVMTFDDFVGLLGGEMPAALRSAEGVGLLAQALGDFREPLGVWEGRLHELYSELRAHVVGRTAPRNRLDLVEREAYEKTRVPVIEEKPARTAHQIAMHLEKSGRLAEVFPGPIRARMALAAFKARPVPPLIARLHWIVVDEVQDLLPVEVRVVVELVRWLKNKGQELSLIFAGDEGQTVRPTDFGWSELHTLVSRRLEPPAAYSLPANLRSPRNVARVIEKLGELYHRVDKSERPRGATTVESDEALPGRIAICRISGDEELEKLHQLFSDTPEAALVYPGHEVPESWLRGAKTEVWTSETAKGLDFRVVGLLDAAETIAQLSEDCALIESARSRQAFVRTRIDQLRVAASRSTDMLVFVDRANNSRTTNLDYLLSDLDGVLEVVTLEELAAQLAADASEAPETVLRLVGEIPVLLHEAPEAALHKSRLAVGLLGSEKSPGAVLDPALRREAMRLRGMAALLQARRADELSKGSLYKEANRWLHKAECTEAARGVLAIRDFSAPKDLKNTGQRALELAEGLEQIRRQAPEVEHAYLEAIVQASQAFASGLLPDSASDMQAAHEGVSLLAQKLGDVRPSLREDVRRLCRRVACRLVELGRNNRLALDLLETLEPREWLLEARCQERLLDMGTAALLYERAGDLAEALRVCRLAGFIGESARLAALLGSEDKELLAWGARLIALLNERPEGELSDAEKKTLNSAFKRLSSNAAA